MMVSRERFQGVLDQLVSRAIASKTAFSNFGTEG